MQILYLESYLIEVEYEEETKIQDNVYPDKYSYLTLLQDVYQMFPKFKFDFPICILGTGMNIEYDADIDTMFIKYAKNPYILISV